MNLFPSALIIKIVVRVPYAAKMGCQVPNVLLLTDAILVLRTKSLVEAERHVCSGDVCRYSVKALSLTDADATKTRRQ